MARVVPVDVDNDDAVVGDDDDVDDVVMVMRMFLLMMIQLGVFWSRGSVEIGGAGCLFLCIVCCVFVMRVVCVLVLEECH